MKENISKGLQGHIVSEETREKLRIAGLGKTASVEACAKRGVASRRAWASLTPAERELRILGLGVKGRKRPAAVGRAISAGKAGRRPRVEGASSPYVGVSLKKSTGKWQVAIRTPEGRKYLGQFATALDAAKAYDAAAGPLGLPLNIPKSS